MKVRTSTYIGWVGNVLVVGSFIAVTNGLVSGHNTAYLLANLVGSVGIGYAALRKRDYPPVFLNLVWLAVALIALLYR